MGLGLTDLPTNEYTRFYLNMLLFSEPTPRIRFIPLLTIWGIFISQRSNFKGILYIIVVFIHLNTINTIIAVMRFIILLVW